MRLAVFRAHLGPLEEFSNSISGGMEVETRILVREPSPLRKGLGRVPQCQFQGKCHSDCALLLSCLFIALLIEKEVSLADDRIVLMRKRHWTRPTVDFSTSLPIVREKSAYSINAAIHRYAPRCNSNTERPQNLSFC